MCRSGPPSPPHTRRGLFLTSFSFSPRSCLSPHTPGLEANCRHQLLPKANCFILSYLKLCKASHLPIWITSNTSSVRNSLFQKLQNPYLQSAIPVSALVALVLEIFSFHTFSFSHECPSPEGRSWKSLQTCIILFPPAPHPLRVLESQAAEAVLFWLRWLMSAPPISPRN